MSEEEQLAPDAPISLKEAASILLRGLVAASTLRAAADRGELTIYRIGRRIVTTPADVAAWRESCRVPASRHPGSIVIKGGTDEDHRSLEAARAMIAKLKEGGRRRGK